MNPTPPIYTARLVENVVQARAFEIFRVSLLHHIQTLSLAQLDEFIQDPAQSLYDRALAVRRFNDLNGESDRSSFPDSCLVEVYLIEMNEKL